MNERKPVAMVHVPPRDGYEPVLVVVCDDGSLWMAVPDGEWEEIEPVPGTPAAREQTDDGEQTDVPW